MKGEWKRFGSYLEFKSQINLGWNFGIHLIWIIL